MQTGMTRACLSAAFAGVLAAVLAGAVLAQAADPQVGTWKLNLAKSTRRRPTRTCAAPSQ